MLIVNVVLVFVAIFAMMHYDYLATNEEDYAQDLIRSFAMYARCNGYMPMPAAGQVPWKEIGISSTFFSNRPQRIEYECSKELQDKSMIPIDNVCWILNNFEENTKDDNTGRKNLCMLSENLSEKCSLNGIPISVEMLVNYANYQINYHKINIKHLRLPPKVIYPNMEATILGYIM